MTESEEMVMFRSNPESIVYARALLPEIAELLGVSVSSLENKPKDIQILLAQTYVNNWRSDDITIRIALNNVIRITDVKKEPEKTKYQRRLEMERFR